MVIYGGFRKMSEFNMEIVKSLTNLQSDITDIKITLVENTKSLEHHVKRTDELQDIVEPVAKDYLARKAIEEYEAKKQEKLMYRLKLPGMIVAALAAIGSLITYFGLK
jgi:uncharacterized membrane-anchored protein YhcB (DUF1043 family)